MKALTPRQRQALDLIYAHRDKHGVPPTYRQLGTLLGLKRGWQPTSLLEALANRGYIEIGRGGIQLPRQRVPS